MRNSDNPNSSLTFFHKWCPGAYVMGITSCHGILSLQSQSICRTISCHHPSPSRCIYRRASRGRAELARVEERSQTSASSGGSGRVYLVRAHRDCPGTSPGQRKKSDGILGCRLVSGDGQAGPAARWISKGRPRKSVCHRARASMRGKSKSGTRISAASRFMRRRALWPFLTRAKFLFRGW